MRPIGQRHINIAGSARTKKAVVQDVTACSGEVAACCKTREDRSDAFCDEKKNPECSRHSAMTLIVLLLGLGVGVLVGLLGIGGGAVLVPALAYLLHMDQHMAQGTSLFILLPPLGLGALREYWKQGQVDLPAGILCALGMLIGGYLGGLISVPLPSRQLKGLFGCFLVMAALLLWKKPQPQNQTTSPAGQEPARG
jgi:uncharacterized membrane protein YfcA